MKSIFNFIVLVTIVLGQSKADFQPSGVLGIKPVNPLVSTRSSSTTAFATISRTFIGNYRTVIDFSKDKVFLKPKVWTSVSDFMTNIGYQGTPSSFSGFSRFTLIDPENRTNTGTIRLTYPAGVGSSSGVSGMYSFPGWPYTNITRMTLSYQLYFPNNFRFVKEGKLPGLWGKDGKKSSFDCGGGNSAVLNNCFSIRMLWRNSTGAGAACIEY
jgi:hypothetical protein